jgi:pimeloyl-ACP methyl ester carboxylesterase
VSALFLIISLVLVVIVGEILFHLLVLKISLPIFEQRPPIGAELFPAVPGAEAITIKTRDGLSLAGNLLRTTRESARGIILFCHEMDSNRWSAASYCEGLLAAGFHVLTFDFRNQGDSQSVPGYQPLHWPSVLEVEDVCAAVKFISERADLARLPLGVYGMSRGASIAVVAAVQCDAIDRIVCDGAYCCNEMLMQFTNRWGRLYFPELFLRLVPRWHRKITLWLIRRASEMRRGFRYANVQRAMSLLGHKRVLMISGERDTYVFPEVTRNLHARTGLDDSWIWIVPEAKHNASRQGNIEEYDRRLVEFFTVLEPCPDEPSPAFRASPSNKAGGPGSGRPVLAHDRSPLYSAD